MGLFLIALVFIGAFTITVVSNKNGVIYQKFFGKVSSYQGVLELWNIDTFEGGTASKASFLEKTSLMFEKENKGAYILVRNMTHDECKTRLNEGQLPDVFSFSKPTAHLVKDYLTELEENSNVREVLSSSGTTINHELLALPWCMSGYALISSDGRLSASGIDFENMFSNVYNSGYVKKLKKSSQNIYSIVYGEKLGCNPSRAISVEADIKGITLVKNELSCWMNTENLTPYNAYSIFVNGKSSILLGGARDLVRAQGRISANKETDIVVSCLSYYTDMVQYFGVVKGVDKDKQKTCENFVKFNLQPQIQTLIKNIGLFSVINLTNNLYEDGFLFDMEKSLDSLSHVDAIFN